MSVNDTLLSWYFYLIIFILVIYFFNKSRYHAKNVTDLHILDRWQKADTSKTLAVPLGLRGKDDVVDLNLHERAHGPHGLIAGTTGSGKSEVIQSYILSLAVNFAPEDVGFLPIDYKGGGMANLFAKLPHLMGTITNLDGAGTERALKSIRAELNKRQEWFRKYHVNNINAYTKLYKKGKTITDPEEKKNYPDQPLPHLFLISDEFAELKANEPEFMDELVSTARIGRSLGVHLILATQKPSGVVNDQIWSNSRFKIALKVAEPADSKEIIHTPDAASITQPGRAYLQVGNNEIYELFQTAYSGATYQPDREEDQKVDNRIWMINHLGQAELLTTDLSEEDQEEQVDEDITQLDAVVDEVVKESKVAKSVIPLKPWLPPLKEVIHGPEINWREEWQKKCTLSVPFGLLDIPSHQEQKPMNFDLAEFSPAVLIGSSGYGKSMALQTLILNLAKENSPEQMQFYLLDFGTNGLLPLAQLPHVGDIASFENIEKLNKMLKRLSSLIDERKGLLQENGVSTLEQYENLLQIKLPVIVVALDAYDTVTENEDYRETIDLIITKLLREGQALGIYTIMTANRYSSFRLTITSNITKKIGLYMVDETAPRDLLGRNVLTQSAVPGRGQMEFEDEVLAFQIYTPMPDTDSLEIINDIRELSTTMDQEWQGNRPKKIPMLPEKLDQSGFANNEQVQKAWQEFKLPLGFEIESTLPYIFDLNRDGYLVMLYNSLSQQQGLQKAIVTGIDHLKGKVSSILMKLTNSDDSFTSHFDTVIEDEGTNIADQFADLKDEVENREVDGGGIPMLIYVLGAHQLGNKLMDSEDDFNDFLLRARKVQIYFIFDAPEKQFFAQFNNVVKAIKNNIPIGIIGSRFRDQSNIDIEASYREPRLKQNEVNAFKGQRGVRIQVLS
ncbi:type VII secretion protein EssC [Lactobacillus rodentium]|uniref:type VII secretion protein EssC n=1 Tax=Lactobacillus rodentium TaxID=947835 RepID=UPI000E3B83CD|nr:type VII secretion protein EssC [Lactobacillus rodentium]